MRKLYYFFVLISVLNSCKVDNYEPPSTALQGKLVFGNQEVHVRQGIPVLQLFEPGFDNETPIPVNVKQDGSFSSILFDGSYKLFRIAGNGPWENNPDTIYFQVKGTTHIDVPVTPFFSIRDVSFHMMDGILTASCRVQQNVSGRTLESVSLFVGKTNLIDHIDRLNTTDPESTVNNVAINEEIITLKQRLATFDSEPHLFARIGIKTLGHPELIYSVVWKVR